MPVKTIICREHGGTFKIEARRGRPPVRCMPGIPCTQANPHQFNEAKAKAKPISRVEKVASTIKNRRSETHSAVRGEYLESAKAPRINSESRSRIPKSAKLAQATKAALEEMGWTVKGRGWTNEENNFAELTASRGNETLVMEWQNDKLLSQDYSLWHDKPSRNGKPQDSLPFDVNELSDSELIRAIAGMKVTWWNALAKSEETYVVSADKLSIEHFYASNGIEDSSRRIVKFIDLNGGGYRHFHAEALLKVK